MGPEDWDRRYEGADLLWTAEANRFLVAEVGSMPPGRALDLGCGEGRNAVWLAERGWRVTAVDFSGVGLAKGRRLADARCVTVEWVLADLLAYEPPPEAFDLVVVLYLHLLPPDRRLVHRRAVGGLAAGGTILVVGYDSRNLTDGWGGPQDPTILFTPADVVDDLEGLAVERAETVRRPVDTNDGERVALDALIVGRRAPGSSGPRPPLAGGGPYPAGP